jgi:hypothetical protein
MQASAPFDLAKPASPGAQRETAAFLSAVVVMIACIAAAGLAMRAAEAPFPTTPDGRFATHYSVGARMPFPVIMDHDHGWAFLGIFFAFVAVFALASLRAVAAVGKTGVKAPVLLLAGVGVVAVVMTAFPATFSLDSYAYAAFGRLLGVEHVNPYLEHLASPAMPNDPVLIQLVSFLGAPLPDENYGPLWTLLAGALAALVQNGGLGLAVWAHRIAGACALLAACAGLLHCNRALAPQARAQRAALFGLHPLAMYESAAAGHNDMLMIAPAVWAFALAGDLPLLAGALLGAAVAVKYVAIVAAPFLAVLAYRRAGIRGAMSACLAILAVPIILFVPLWPGSTAIGTLFNLGANLIMSLPWLATMWLPSTLTARVAATIGVAAAAVVVYSLARYVRDASKAHLFRAIAAVLWASPLLNPWYVQWLLPAAAQAGRWARYAWWFGLVAMLRYVEDALRFPSDSAEMALRITLLEAGTVVILVLPVALAFVRSASFNDSQPALPKDAS